MANTANSEEPVKVADNLNPLRPNPFHSLSAKCPA
jgi:hypothetical protein